MVESQTLIIMLAVGGALMLAGFYGFKRAQPSVAIRVVLGIVMLVAGVALAYPIIADDLADHAVRLGVSIALVGLGINQAATPIRLAFGKSA